MRKFTVYSGYNALHSDMVEKYNTAAIVEKHGEVNNQKHLLDCASNLLIQERTMNTMLSELHDLDNILCELHNLYLTICKV
jgi:hypothetical protein